MNQSPLQNTSLASLQNLVNPTSSSASSPSITGAGPAAASSLEGVLNSQPQDLTSYFQTNVFDPLNKTFQQQTLPGIASFFGGSLGGPQSTAAADAVGQATGNFEDTLASTQGNLALAEANQNQTNKLNAAEALPGVANEPLQQLMALLGAGGVTPGLQQQNVGNQLTGFQDVAQQTQSILSDLVNFLATQTQTAANQPVVQGGQSGILTGILTALAGNQGIGNAIGGRI